MKRCCILLLILCFLLGGCAPAAQKQYNAVYLDLFDTVTTIIGSGDSEEQFRQEAQKIYEQFLVYNRLFDIFNDYEGINNLKTVNDNAGIAPVKVDSAIIELLLDCKAYYELTDGKVNAAMGSVLKLWPEARSYGIENPDDAKLPDGDALAHAEEHISFKSIVIDEKASTVYISDPEASLDVGAIAKGWAAQRVAENAPKGMLISVGGNVCATGPKLPDGTPWVIGIQDPDASDKNLHTVFVTENSVVTSGDYQRTYWVEGKPYHHIIDPDTLMPAAYWRSVSIICPDSGLADALSTALFLMGREEGEALAKECGAEVLWVAADGAEYMTDGFKEMLRT